MLGFIWKIPKRSFCQARHFRLLAYMNVSGIAFPGVQSGFNSVQISVVVYLGLFSISFLQIFQATTNAGMLPKPWTHDGSHTSAHWHSFSREMHNSWTVLHLIFNLSSYCVFSSHKFSTFCIKPFFILFKSLMSFLFSRFWLSLINIVILELDFLYYFLCIRSNTIIYSLFGYVSFYIGF